MTSLKVQVHLRRLTADCERLKVVDSQYDELTHKIIGCAMKVHSVLASLTRRSLRFLL